MVVEARVHPDCINAANPYHECVDYCYRKIDITKARDAAQKLDKDKDDAKAPADRIVHPDCMNASNSYHECSEFCFRTISERKDKSMGVVLEKQHKGDISVSKDASYPSQLSLEKRCSFDQQIGDDGNHGQNDAEVGFPNLLKDRRSCSNLGLKCFHPQNEARKANQIAMVAEKKKYEGV